MRRRSSHDALGGPPTKHRKSERRTTREGRLSGSAQLVWLLIAASLFFPAAVTSLRGESATFDEPVYLVAGLSYLTLADFTMKDDAPPLVAYLAGISPWTHGLRIPGERLGFDDSLGHEYPFASKVLYAPRVDADGILFWSRLAVLVPFGLLLLVTTFLWAGALYGPAAGVVAVLLVALCPNLLAHARLVSCDFAATATMLFASFLLWRFTLRPVPGRAVAAGGALALALVSKFTTLVLLPCTAVVLALLLVNAPRSERRRVASSSAVLFATAAVLVSLVYGWPPAPDRYVHGVESIYRNIHSDQPWFLWGSLHAGPIRHYYAAVLGMKTTLALLVLAMAGIFAMRRRNAGLFAEICLLLPAVVLLVASSFDAAASGIRRILPVLPILAIHGSRCAALQNRVALGGVGLAVVLHGASSLGAWPHYLPYYNELARAAWGEWALSDDSDIDWGQDLKALPAVLARHRIERVRLLYFGTARPEYYGIKYDPVSVEALVDPAPGIYAVSLQYLLRMRASSAFPWIDQQTPFDRAGTSILLYRFGPEPLGWMSLPPFVDTGAARPHDRHAPAP